MGYITAVLGLQARSRRNARNASRALSLRRSQAASAARAADRRFRSESLAQADPPVRARVSPAP